MNPVPKLTNMRVGTRPPCKGRIALPDRRAIRIPESSSLEPNTVASERGMTTNQTASALRAGAVAQAVDSRRLLLLPSFDFESFFMPYLEEQHL